MKLLFSILFTLLATLSFGQVSWSQGDVTSLGGERYRLDIEVAIDEGWHIYDLEQRDGGPLATTVRLSLPPGGKIIGALTANQKAHIVEDSALGMSLGYFGGMLRLSQEFSLPAPTDSIELSAEWMACNDMSCSPPEELSKIIAIPAAKTSLWLLLLEAALWGFAALLTPCIFPMIPMTISYFLKGEHSRRSALLYGLFIVLLYTLPIALIISVTYLFGGDAVTANIFNWVATHWLPNVLFFAVFILFAASFFGLFELSLPSSWINRSDSRADRSSVGGIFFLALTLVLVSFSCTGPIVGSVLIKSTSGEIWQPMATMFIFSLAFALPFVVVSMSPALLGQLPKSGGWLSSVKITLGFIELALAFKFLSVADQSYQWGILSRELYLIIWIVIFTLLGVYLLGGIRFKDEQPAPTIGFVRLLLSMMVLGFSLYMLTGLFGAPLAPLSGYLPPPTRTITERSMAAQSSSLTGLNIVYDIEQAREISREQKRPILVDFTGYGCVNCRNMEQRVWSDGRVEALLKEYIILALYMDDRTALPEGEQVVTSSGRVLRTKGARNAHYALERYGVNSQPYYILEDSAGGELAPARGYDLSIEGYIDFLEEGLRSYSNLSL